MGVLTDCPITYQAIPSGFLEIISNLHLRKLSCPSHHLLINKKAAIKNKCKKTQTTQISCLRARFKSTKLHYPCALQGFKITNELSAVPFRKQINGESHL